MFLMQESSHIHNYSVMYLNLSTVDVNLVFLVQLILNHYSNNAQKTSICLIYKSYNGIVFHITSQTYQSTCH